MYAFCQKTKTTKLVGKSDIDFGKEIRISTVIIRRDGDED